MKTLTINFKSNGEEVKRVAIISDDHMELSKSKKNQAGDIITDTIEDGYWSIFFIESDTLQYEVEFSYDEERGCTLLPMKALTWENDIITDETYAKVKIQ